MNVIFAFLSTLVSSLVVSAITGAASMLYKKEADKQQEMREYILYLQGIVEGIALLFVLGVGSFFLLAFFLRSGSGFLTDVGDTLRNILPIITALVIVYTVFNIKRKLKKREKALAEDFRNKDTSSRRQS